MTVVIWHEIYPNYEERMLILEQACAAALEMMEQGGMPFTLVPMK